MAFLEPVLPISRSSSGASEAMGLHAASPRAAKLSHRTALSLALRIAAVYACLFAAGAALVLLALQALPDAEVIAQEADVPSSALSLRFPRCGTPSPRVLQSTDFVDASA